MEPVKGGGLASVPEAVEKTLKEKAPDHSIASWAIRFVGSLDGLICCLSGMSSVEQVKDNIRTYRELEPLSASEMNWLSGEINALYRSQGPVKDLEKYEGLKLYGVPVTAIMEGYNVCQLQPDPRDFKEELPKETLINRSGEDVTAEVYEAYEWLRAHTF